MPFISPWRCRLPEYSFSLACRSALLTASMDSGKTTSIRARNSMFVLSVRFSTSTSRQLQANAKYQWHERVHDQHDQANRNDVQDDAGTGHLFNRDLS